MEVQSQAARGKPFVSRVDLFDSLMTVSFMTKALANKVLMISEEKPEEGGADNATEDTQHPCSK